MENAEKQADQHYTVESFEGDWAVLEVSASQTFNVPKAWLPDAAAEGNVLKITLEDGGEERRVRFALDTEATADLKGRVSEARAKRSVPKAPPGDIEI